MEGIFVKNNELVSIVIVKNDLKLYGFFLVNCIVFGVLRVWGIVVFVVGIYFFIGLYCYLILIKFGGVCGIII